MSLGTEDQWYGRDTCLHLYRQCHSSWASNRLLLSRKGSSENKRSTWRFLKFGGKTVFISHIQNEGKTLWAFFEGNLCQHLAAYSFIPFLSVFLSLWNCDGGEMVQKWLRCAVDFWDAPSVQPGPGQSTLWLLPALLPRGNRDMWQGRRRLLCSCLRQKAAVAQGERAGEPVMGSGGTSAKLLRYWCVSAKPAYSLFVFKEFY